MEKFRNALLMLLPALFCLVLFVSCKKEKQDPENIAPIGQEDAFNGVYVSRDPRMNPSVPEHRYIWFSASFHRRKSSALFGGTSIAEIASDNQFGEAYIRTRFLAPGNQILGLQKDQYARMIYVERDNKKHYFTYGGKDQGQLSLGQLQGDGTNTERNENTWWIIHEFTGASGFKRVAIEAYANRGHYIMNEGTLNGDTRIRIMQRSRADEATLWEVHKP